MGIFNLDTSPRGDQPAGVAKTPAPSSEAAASASSARPDPSRPIPPSEPPVPAPPATHDPIEREPLKTLELKPKLIEALSTVYDPEIPVNIYELGLIYDVDVNADGLVGIRMTLTSPGCPAAQTLPVDPPGRSEGEGPGGARGQRCLGRRRLGAAMGHEQHVRCGQAAARTPVGARRQTRPHPGPLADGLRLVVVGGSPCSPCAAGARQMRCLFRRRLRLTAPRSPRSGR